jgi:hypothetical protein
MPNAPARTGNTDDKRLAAIDRLLIAGIKLGPSKKREAIDKVLALVPEWKRRDCWQRIRHLRKTGQVATIEERQAGNPKTSKEILTVRRPPPRPWTTIDDDKLLDLAGYEPVAKIAQRLGRSVCAVRFRLGSLGMSARVTDGWSLRALRKLLRVSPIRLRYLIANNILRIRDSRVSAESLLAYCEKTHASLNPDTADRLTAALARGDKSFSWERAADVLGVDLTWVKTLISEGKLKLVDTFVTDRAFEEFCRKHGDEINTALIDPATVKWLVSEYGVARSALGGKSLSPTQKHALVMRECKCGRKIAGNVYFRHVRRCAALTGDAKSRAS